MAKDDDKKQLGGALGEFAKRTEPPANQPPARPPADNSDLGEGKLTPTGVGLREGELNALDGIGAALGQALGVEPIRRNALMREAVRRFIIDWRAGKITAEELSQVFVPPAKPKAKYRPR